MTKTYGIYPGSVKEMEAYLNNCSEVALYLTLRDKSGFLRFMLDDLRDAGYEYYDVTEDRYAVDYLICQTSRFGTKVKSGNNDQRVARTEAFLEWYSIWGNHLADNIPPEEQQLLLKKALNQEDVYFPHPVTGEEKAKTLVLNNKKRS